MYNVDKLWQITTDENVFEFNGSHTVNVYDREQPHSATDVDMWSVSESYTDAREFARDVMVWTGELTYGAWIVSDNQAGYLPDNESDAFSDHADALEALLERALAWSESDDEKQESVNALDPDHDPMVSDDSAPSSVAWAESLRRDIEMSGDSVKGDEMCFIVRPNSPTEIDHVFTLAWSEDQPMINGEEPMVSGDYI